MRKLLCPFELLFTWILKFDFQSNDGIVSFSDGCLILIFLERNLIFMGFFEKLQLFLQFLNLFVFGFYNFLKPFHILFFYACSFFISLWLPEKILFQNDTFLIHVNIHISLFERILRKLLLKFFNLCLHLFDFLIMEKIILFNL